MRFREFMLNEEAPGMPPAAGGMPPGGPMGAPPGGAPMGAPPMGGAPGGDMGMGGGMGGAPAPMAGPPPAQPVTIPRKADVWDVLDHILNGKPLENEEKKNKAMDQKASTAMPPPPMPSGPVG